MAKSVIINGVTYSDVPQVAIPLAGGSGSATFFETSGDDVAAADVKNGKKYHGASGSGVGNMPTYESGADSGTITTAAGTIQIAAGWHDGNGEVDIDQTGIVSENIKNGAAILGVPGKSTVVDTELASGGAGASQILNGYKAWVNGVQYTGSLTTPTVSQDASTKVLTIV